MTRSVDHGFCWFKVAIVGKDERTSAHSRGARRDHTGRRSIRAALEPLETRELLSATPPVENLHVSGVGTLTATEGTALSAAIATFSDPNGTPPGTPPSRRGYFNAQLQKDIDEGKKPVQDPPDFIYRAGCTFLLDPNTMDIRRVIRTPGTITDSAQLERMRAYMVEGGSAAVNAFYSRHEGIKRKVLRADEPFALLHSEVGG